MRWPLTICAAIVIESVARPALTSRIVMPSPLLASSSFHIASAQARARSLGERVALPSDMVVIYHDPVAYRSCLAGEDKSLLEFPRLKRVIHFHPRLALDEPRATGRAHAALAG